MYHDGYISKPPEKMFVFTRDMTIERAQVWNTMSNVNSIIPLAIPVNDFFMIHCKSRSIRWTTLEKKKEKKGGGKGIIFIFTNRISAFLPFLSPSKYRIKSRYGYPLEIYLKLGPGLFANRKETMAFVWRSPPRNRI